MKCMTTIRTQEDIISHVLTKLLLGFIISFDLVVSFFYLSFYGIKCSVMYKVFVSFNSSSVPLCGKQQCDIGFIYFEAEWYVKFSSTLNYHYNIIVSPSQLFWHNCRQHTLHYFGWQMFYVIQKRIEIIGMVWEII